MKKLWSLAILLASALLILIQKVNAFTLDIADEYFDWPWILTWNRAEIDFEDYNNLWYWAFFIWSWIDTNTTLVLKDDRNDTREINCKKQLNWYYTIIYNSFLMLWLDNWTVEYTNHYNLTENVNFVTWWLFYDCTCTWWSCNILRPILTWIYWYVERTYWLNDEENTHKIRAGIDKDTSIRANISPLELVYSNSSWYTSKTLSGEFYSNLTKFSKVLPRAIWDVWIGNAEYKSWTYVVKYENFTQDWIDIRIITSTFPQDVQVDIVWQYEDNNWYIYPHNDAFTLVTNLSVPTNVNNIFWFWWFYWYTITGYKRNYREFSWTITLTITGVTDPQSRSINFRIEGWEPCLSWRDNDYFITPDFWELNWHRLWPTDAQIKCAIFWYEDNRYNESNWAGYQTAYTKWRTNYTSWTACSITKVIRSWNLPSTLEASTIYVLTSTWANVPNSISIPSCTAIVSKTEVKYNLWYVPRITTYYWIDTTLRDTTLNLNWKHIVLDNISIKANGNWININSWNSTLNMVKVYNWNIWISLNNVSHVLLNNIQSFNNNIWIQLNNWNANAINNTQVYRNNLWINMSWTNQNIIYNSSIYRNSTWLKVLWSNYNIFNKINLYTNAPWSSGHNLYIETWLINTWININQNSNNILLFTGNTGVIINWSTTVLISWRNWISLWYPLKSKYGYECDWWTTWTCLVDGSSWNINYICTWTIMYEDFVTDTLFTANWFTIDQLPRDLSISWNNISINITKRSWNNENNETPTTYTESTNTEIDIIWWSTGNNDTDGYYIFYNNESLINGEFHPDSNWNYNVNLTFEYTDYTWYWSMELIYNEFTWATYDLDTLWNTLCEFDWGFYTWWIINEQYYNKPQIIWNTWLLSEYSNTWNINMFSYSAWLWGFSDSWDYTTNPQKGTNQYIYNRHASMPDGKWKSTGNNIYSYSYWVSISLQENVLLFDWSEWGKIKKPHDNPSENYYIGSHVPKVSITSNVKTITKINYIVSWDSANRFWQTKYDIASLIGSHFIKNLTTVLTWQDYSWYNGPVWTGVVISWWTNQVTWITLGTSTILYLKTGDLEKYYILLQTYWDSYFSSHKYIQKITRQGLKLTVYPTDTCRYYETITLTGNRNTPNDTWANVTWLDVTWIIDIHPIYWVSRLTPTTWIEISHQKLLQTWRTTRTIQIPCNTWQVCGTKPMIKTSWIQYVQDMRGFISNTDTFREIYRDLKWPSIKITTGNVYECSTKTVTINLQDQCIWNSWFKISWENFIRGWIVTWTTHYNETWFVPLITKWSNSYTSKNYYISSGFIWRTWSTTNTTIIKTLNITARDKFSNETTWTFIIKVDDIKPRLQRWKNANSAVLLLSWKRITWYTEQHTIYPIDILWAEEKTWANNNLITCGTADLRIQNFGCENYLTWIISDDITLTVMPKLGEDWIWFKSWLVCRIQIVDNENSIVTWYIQFNVNTIHKPLYQDPLIVSWTKYIDYENEELENYYENKNRTDRSGHNNEELKIKYTSWDTVYLDIWEVNEFVEYYHIECSGDYYTNTWLYSETASEWKSYYDDVVYSWDTKLLIFSGRKNQCNTWQITWIKVTIRNWSGEWVDWIWKVQITTWDADYIFYDYTRPETIDMDSWVNNSVNNPYDEDAIIIADWQTLTNRVQVKDRSEIDHRPNIFWYTEGFYIQKIRAKNILSLRILSGQLEEIRDGVIRIDNETPISPRPLRPGTDPISDPTRPIDPNLGRIETRLVRKRIKQLKADLEWEILQNNRLTTGPILDIRGTLKGNDNDNKIEEKRIWLKIGTWLLHDFSINDSKIIDIITKYRYTNRNPIFVKWRQTSTWPEWDISRLIVQIETWEINTWNLVFELRTAKRLDRWRDSIDCTWYNTLWHFSDCEIDRDSEGTIEQQTKRICKLRYTWWIMPICVGDRIVVWDSYIYSWIYHRNASFKRKYRVSYNIFSWEDTWYYFSSDHTGEREFYGKVSLTDNTQRYNDEYIMIKIVDRKTPFKVWIKWQEMEYYWTIFDAVTSTSWDNSFFFYITHPQRINIEWGLKSWMIWDISYEINFNTWVADEFYYITWESTVNWYKETIWIKRPTFNYANPKGYLFNFPDYTYYE